LRRFSLLITHLSWETVLGGQTYGRAIPRNEWATGWSRSVRPNNIHSITSMVKPGRMRQCLAVVLHGL